MQYMKLVLDTDCLIKLTKAGLKERVCEEFEISIPMLVRVEAVDRGGRRPDAERIRSNIRDDRLDVHSDPGRLPRGEEAAYALFQTGRYDAVGTDDRRFVRRLRADGVPYVTPCVLVVLLARRGTIDRGEANAALESLAPHVSEDEVAMARAVLGLGGSS